MHIKFLIITLLTTISYTSCFDLILGDKVGRTMVYHQRVKTYALPFVKRIKTVSYENKDQHKRAIKAIFVIDQDFSEASANVTAGGVGFNFVSIRLKSQRSQPLNYEVEIYA